MGILNEKLPCSCGVLTRSRDEKNRPLCKECKRKKAEKEVEERLEKRIQEKIGDEGIRVCPACNADMEKKTYPKKKELLEDEDLEFIVFDKCPICRSVFLDKGELRKIMNLVQEDAESEGSNSGFASGLVFGLIID